MRKLLLNSVPFIAAGLVFAGVRAAIKNPGLAEDYYSNGLYPVIASTVSHLSGLMHLSLWDLFWSLAVFTALAGLIAVLKRRSGFGKYALRVLQGGAIVYSLFYIMWGFNYFRLPVSDRMGWKDIKPDTVVFRSIIGILIAEANASYCEIGKEQYNEIDRLVEDSYRANAGSLKLPYPMGARKPKRMIFSSLFIRSDVSGYFGPLFNEVHINGYLLPVDFPFVLAHEKAHQFGIASEAEANLAAYVVCSGFDDRRLRYSSSIHLLLYFLRDAVGTPAYHGYISKIDGRVLADLRRRSQYYDRMSNKSLGMVQRKANDMYLKSNHIKKGVINYSQVVELVILWHTDRGL